MKLRLLLSAASALSVCAQDWGIAGAWQQVIPVPLSPGANISSPPVAFSHAAVVPGFLLLAGNTSDGNPDLWLFNIVLQQWTNPFDFIPASSLSVPFISSHGGVAIMVDELAPNTLRTIDTSLPSGPWATVTTSGAPVNRIAQRFLDWGSTMYAFGGYDVQAMTTFNDLYALDSTAALAGTPTPWVLVSPPAVNGITPAYPPPRIGYTWTPFTVGAIMMGGLSLTNPDGSPASGDPFACVRPNPPAGCLWHSHVWAFLPGAGQPKTAGGVPATAWIRLGQNGVKPGPAGVPAGRVEHCAGNMGDQLYVYGGITATGPSNELWAYNLVSQTWALVAPSSPAPDARSGTFWSTGTVVGHSFYLYQTAPDRASPGALWRWTPSAGGLAPAPASGVSNAVVMGHTAGITLSVMLGVATLYVAVLLANAAGLTILPSCGGLLGGAPKTSPAGFYSSSANAGPGDGYVAPPTL